MRKRSERSIVFFAAIFVFVCLLFSGGSRLIGHEGGSPAPVQAAPLEGVLLCAAPAPLGETGGRMLDKTGAVLQYLSKTASISALVAVQDPWSISEDPPPLADRAVLISLTIFLRSMEASPRPMT